MPRKAVYMHILSKQYLQARGGNSGTGVCRRVLSIELAPSQVAKSGTLVGRHVPPLVPQLRRRKPRKPLCRHIQALVRLARHWCMSVSRLAAQSLFCKHPSMKSSPSSRESSEAAVHVRTPSCDRFPVFHAPKHEGLSIKPLRVERGIDACPHYFLRHCISYVQA